MGRSQRTILVLYFTSHPTQHWGTLNTGNQHDGGAQPSPSAQTTQFLGTQGIHEHGLTARESGRCFKSFCEGTTASDSQRGCIGSEEAWGFPGWMGCADGGPISHHNTRNWRKTKSNGETKLARRNSSPLPHLLVLPLEATVLIF